MKVTREQTMGEMAEWSKTDHPDDIPDSFFEKARQEQMNKQLEEIRGRAIPIKHRDHEDSMQSVHDKIALLDLVDTQAAQIAELELLIDVAAWLFSSSDSVRDNGLVKIIDADEPAFIALIEIAQLRETNQILKLNMEQGLEQLRETGKPL